MDDIRELSIKYRRMNDQADRQARDLMRDSKLDADLSKRAAEFRRIEEHYRYSFEREMRDREWKALKEKVYGNRESVESIPIEDFASHVNTRFSDEVLDPSVHEKTYVLTRFNYGVYE